ncbi:MAG: hypothetical protein K8W52_41375 [Deltaproteobacteria bacterium]|nr:hypothetical protein [Deltaproteobacteria bacterium]
MQPSSTTGTNDLLRAIRHIDHVTYAGRLTNEQPFIAGWAQLGFHTHVRLETRRFPATHIALTNGATEGAPWGIMTGLSVSASERSPINEFVRRYGEGIQHVAYSVDPRVDLDDVRRALEARGVAFMTPVLTYADDRTGAGLRQTFTAPAHAFGTFVEYVQRLPGRDGQPFDGFDIENIDGLYGHYAEYSAWLERHEDRTPPRIDRPC